MEIVEQQTEFSLDRSASHLLHRAQQFAAEQFEGLDGVDITLRQFAVLAAVREQEGCSQSELVKTTGIDRSTLADMVQRMEKNGLIERRQAKLDARAKSVHLTEGGRTSLESAMPMVQKADEAILSMLPKNRRRAFIGILGLLANVGDIGFDELDSPVDVKAKKKTNDAGKKKKKSKKDKKKKKEKD
ncbi:MarR family winged helix-turn-helix transcriptional regulator [Ponticaulis profundi]|uniref:MarR family winged helix-turn-helix transcriptional regulator n=1 Tax=Ponticaulis profundi TaxID=2665222 RepID=A0ABW1S9A5_9PROT